MKGCRTCAYAGADWHTEESSMPERLEYCKQFLRSAPPPERRDVAEGGVVAGLGLVGGVPPRTPPSALENGRVAELRLRP
eukprot:2584398-Alexandrium_andersonii.AAC.1